MTTQAEIVETVIRTLQGDVTVMAIKVTQHFAIHDAIGDMPAIAVTHAATGYRAFRATNLALAVACARALERIGADWDFTKPGGAAAVRLKHFDVLKAISQAVKDEDLEALQEIGT